MSYLVGSLFPSVSTVKTAAETAAAAATPTGLLWMAPSGVQQQAGRVTSPVVKTGIASVSQAQTYLMQLSLYPGPASGILDQNTQQALDTFRGYAGLPTGGGVTQQDIAALQAAVTNVQQGVVSPTPQPTSTAAPSMFDSLPVWALPVAAVAGAVVLMKVLQK